MIAAPSVGAIFDSPEVRTNKMLFGTDDDTFTYGDVRRFDFGSDPIVSDYADTTQAIALLPNNVIEKFISARAPQKSD